ncbi:MULTISPECIES: 3-keto-5-aminohexanoate cleavage protein [unclassified Mesorhizobium]|uniref:3-keto-5-aminohexanoate cleavage protein n=1 Tax=unclassified Mesorhizobium TaxID=325217 RepID=UPI0003CF96FD|nr:MULTISPECIES: 3-keto-5-aminohexanoate cleavage protein [unclassified Mesorhizobium]ESY45951.1 NADPH dependend quinone reductase [Mesorhizobium sp. LNJC374B00]ESY50735.1 NADPH dependend quinone reductase [Mesorhizobium sp. LNJC372A00]WJI80973.1 3-keto-5-aminohexanoate cleavage protein [Mesorhizobium sp. C374B]WJI87513.1 3-keto-5-aminohexanoate cleavage protein [Mesorhizobium sp. C372A]
MNRTPFITCAVTGGGDVVGKSPHVPVTPLEIADSALEAHEAGAAIVHLHVRDPATGVGSRDIGLFRELVTIIRRRNTDVIINLTGGMGGAIVFGQNDAPLAFAEGTDCIGPHERMKHIIELKPEIASLDTGSLNVGDSLYATTPTWLRTMADQYKNASVLPEIEVFELGHIELAKQLIGEGRMPQPLLFQLCLGVKYGAPATPDAMLAMRNALPANAVWAGFGLGAMQLPMASQAVLMGGNIRVGLEDNLYLEHGVLATNVQLVAKARRMVEDMGAKVLSASDTRAALGLKPRS